MRNRIKIAIKWVDCGRGLFASAHLIRAASERQKGLPQSRDFASAHLIRAASYCQCVHYMAMTALPQHTSYELHPKSIADYNKYGVFASAHLIRAASAQRGHVKIRCRLCLSTPHTSCIVPAAPSGLVQRPLPQHTSYELHRQNCTEKWMQHCKMCCERVDSFSAT